MRKLAGSAFMFHAAGLATTDGQVIALVGPSGRGKTTAAQALGKALSYVTDETVAFRPDLSIIPFPKPLSIGRRPGVKQLAPPAEFGMRVIDQPAQLAALVLLDRHTEDTAPRLERVNILDALGDLVGQSSSLARLPDPLRSLTDVIAKTGGVRRFVYSKADDLFGLVDSLFESAPAPIPATRTVDCTPIDPTTMGNLGRSEYTDALEIDGSIAILSDGQLHILNGIGPEIWRHANDATVEEIVAHIRRVHGNPPPGVDDVETTTAAINALVDAKLLVRSV